MPGPALKTWRADLPYTPAFPALGMSGCLRHGKDDITQEPTHNVPMSWMGMSAQRASQLATYGASVVGTYQDGLPSTR